MVSHRLSSSLPTVWLGGCVHAGVLPHLRLFARQLEVEQRCHDGGRGSRTADRCVGAEPAVKHPALHTRRVAPSPETRMPSLSVAARQQARASRRCHTHASRLRVCAVSVGRHRRVFVCVCLHACVCVRLFACVCVRLRACVRAHAPCAVVTQQRDAGQALERHTSGRKGNSLPAVRQEPWVGQTVQLPSPIQKNRSRRCDSQVESAPDAHMHPCVCPQSVSCPLPVPGRCRCACCQMPDRHCRLAAHRPLSPAACQNTPRSAHMCCLSRWRPTENRPNPSDKW